jgi:hypothetical protein
MRLFFSKYVAARRYQSRMALRVTTRDENESLRLPHPCALVAAGRLLHTTRSLKLLSKAAWEYRDSRETIHKGVLMRMRSLGEIRSETLRLGDILTTTNAAQLTAATHRRKQ